MNLTFFYEKAAITMVLIAISTTAEVAHGLPVLNSYADVDPGMLSPDTAVSDVGTDSAIATLVSIFGASKMSATASSSASYTELGAVATATLENYETGSFFVEISPSTYSGTEPARATALSTDTLTITGGTGVGYLLLGYDIDGTADTPAQAIADIFSDDLRATPVATIGLFGPGSLAGVLEFTYDAPFTFTHRLSAFTGVFDSDIGISEYDYSGTADFSSTSTLATFSVFSDIDLSNPTTRFSVIAESGTDYIGFVNVVAVPPTALLIGIGLLFILGRPGRQDRNKFVKYARTAICGNTKQTPYYGRA